MARVFLPTPDQSATLYLAHFPFDPPLYCRKSNRKRASETLLAPKIEIKRTMVVNSHIPQLAEMDDLDYQTQQLSGLFHRLAPDAAALAAPYLPRLLAANLRGDVCLPLRRDEAQTLRQASPLVGGPGDVAPLVLSYTKRTPFLYFARHWLAEQQLARQLKTLATTDESLPAKQAVQALDGLFHDGGRPQLAAALALRKHLLIIGGGPGTGKTSTVVRLMAALTRLAAAQHKPFTIAMAAPTGKAAARLAESVRRGISQLPLNDALRGQLPTQAHTLHRLLGLRPGSSRGRFHADNPLPVDVLIIDEASMVDLILMQRTVAALPPEARLILLGDPQQLASVEAGAVLAELSRFEQHSPAMNNWLRQVCGELPADWADSSEAPGPLTDCVIILTESHRFQAEAGIGRLANAVRHGDIPAMSHLFNDLLCPEVTWAPGRATLPDAALRRWRPYFDALTDGPQAAFAAFARFMLLGVERRDVELLNQQIARRLEQTNHKLAGSDWYAGRPVMVVENDYSQQLFNGDIGLTLPADDGWRVWFANADGSYRDIAPVRLPATVSAFAMTVHKSQGSEFDEVWLLLPDKTSPVLDRALLYTALTRARTAFAISGDEKIQHEAVLRSEQRYSGLSQQLQHD